MATDVTWSRRETAELPFKKFSKSDRRAVFEIRSEDLCPDRQTGRRTIDRRRARWEAARGGRVRPNKTRIVKGLPRLPQTLWFVMFGHAVRLVHLLEIARLSGLM